MSLRDIVCDPIKSEALSLATQALNEHARLSPHAWELRDIQARVALLRAAADALEVVAGEHKAPATGQADIDAERYRYLRRGNALEPEQNNIYGLEALDLLCDAGIRRERGPVN